MIAANRSGSRSGRSRAASTDWRVPAIPQVAMVAPAAFPDRRILHRLGTWLLVSGVCAACTALPPAPAEYWRAAGVEPKTAEYDAIACQLLMASRCAYDVGRHIGAAGNADAAFCAQMSYREAYGFLGDFTNDVDHDNADARDAVSVAISDTAVIVAFRGTLSPRTKDVSDETIVADWLNDANAPLTLDSQLIAIHHGFAASIAALWPQLVAKLEELRQQGKITNQSTLYVTGHSKGGALAVIAAARLKLDGMPVTAVYTFAAARAGGSAFAGVYRQQKVPTVRYENQDDIVPHLPPDRDELTVLHGTGDSLLRQIPAPVDSYLSVGTLRYITDGLSIIEVDDGNAALERARRDQFAQTAQASLGHLDLLKLLVASHSIDPPSVGQISNDHRYFRAVCTK
jgi:hypothetical protein